VKDLEQRWKEDCLDLKPTVVSILIGINDCWRRYDSNDPTSVENFTRSYRNILQQVKENCNSRLILMEPFVLPVPEDRKQWREDIDPKIHIIRELAREFNAILIPLDGIINSMTVFKNPKFWAADGVHPTKEGHALIAQHWLKTVKAI
jgi:lysophospholipase L1-like esterase